MEEIIEVVLSLSLKRTILLLQWRREKEKADLETQLMQHSVADEDW